MSALTTADHDGEDVAPLHRPGDDALDARIRFLTELARRLHLAGVSSQRLEGAVRATARALHVSAELWSTPTGLLLSLGDADVVHGSQQTRVLRLEPGHVNLRALSALDRIAEEVVAGRRSLEGAWEAMRALDRPETATTRLRRPASARPMARPATVPMLLKATVMRSGSGQSPASIWARSS